MWNIIFGITMLIPWIVAQCVKIKLKEGVALDIFTTVLAVIGVLILAFLG